MGQKIPEPTPTLIDDGTVPDTFVSGIAKIEHITGGLVRIVYYAEREIAPGHIEWQVVAKHVRPAGTLLDNFQKFRDAQLPGNLN